MIALGMLTHSPSIAERIDNLFVLHEPLIPEDMVQLNLPSHHIFFLPYQARLYPLRTLS